MFRQVRWSLLFMIMIGGSVYMGNSSFAADTNAKHEDPSYVAPAPQAGKASELNAYRILFVGNSITRHGVNEDAKSRLKWDHVAGMAASSEDKDFAHRLGVLIQATMKDRKVELYFMGSPYPPPHLVVLQTGEHETPGKTVKERADAYEAFIKPYVNLSPKPLVLCAGVWFPTDNVPYIGMALEVNEAYASVCKKHGIPFVSLEKYATDPSCRGWGQHPGVQWHPNDKGMEGYASLLFKAFREARGALGSQQE